MLEIIGPEGRASLPITIFLFPVVSRIRVPKALANFAASMGVRDSPGNPPMVPRMPEIDFISVKLFRFLGVSVEC